MSRPWSMPDWLVAHRDHYLRDPVAAHDWDATVVGGNGIVPTLLLTTVGRVSGERRSLPLLYQPCGSGWIVVGSRGGSRRHAGWYHNLLAEPHCTVQAGTLRCSARAETLAGAVRERYWQVMTRFWPLYLDYQARTDRQLPVVMLHRTGIESDAR